VAVTIFRLLTAWWRLNWRIRTIRRAIKAANQIKVVYLNLSRRRLVKNKSLTLTAAEHSTETRERYCCYLLPTTTSFCGVSAFLRILSRSLKSCSDISSKTFNVFLIQFSRLNLREQTEKFKWEINDVINNVKY
jgi:hypothetical protein